jgi:hypothetical protein
MKHFFRLDWPARTISIITPVFFLLAAMVRFWLNQRA